MNTLKETTTSLVKSDLNYQSLKSVYVGKVKLIVPT